jgi:hypothetical protein
MLPVDSTGTNCKSYWKQLTNWLEKLMFFAEDASKRFWVVKFKGIEVMLLPKWERGFKV